MTILEKVPLSDRRYDVFDVINTAAISALVGFGAGLMAAYLVFKLTL